MLHVGVSCPIAPISCCFSDCMVSGNADGDGAGPHYRCWYCGRRGFSTFRIFRCHQLHICLNSTERRPRHFVCNRCPFRASLRWIVKQHKKRQHPKNQRCVFAFAVVCFGACHVEIKLCSDEFLTSLLPY